VCGAAPCVFEDLNNALELRPGATILGVNNVAAMIPEIEHVWTQHAEHSLEYKKSAGRKICVHSRSKRFTKIDGAWVLDVVDPRFAGVDYVWPQLGWVAGSSGVAGALWARHGMGFDEVIIAGAPLSHDSLVYSDKYPSKPTKAGKFSEANQLDHWIGMLRSHKDAGKTDGIFSMSGRTRQVLGAPC
jgi:hypothetical protein